MRLKKFVLLCGLVVAFLWITETQACDPCADTSAGEWEDVENYPSCAPDEGSTKLWFKDDDCGNTLELWCRGYYSYEYNGNEVGRCVYNNGLNWFRYRMTANGKRFHSTWHRSHDPDHDGSAADEGTKCKYDWVVWIYDCINGGAVGEYCREDPNQVGYENDGQPSSCE